LKMKKREDQCIRVANSQLSNVQGEVVVPFRVGRTVRVVTVLVVSELSHSLILGMDFWKRFQLRIDFLKKSCEVGAVSVPEEEIVGKEDLDSDCVLTPKQKEELDDIIETYRPLLDKEKLGCAKGVFHHIDTGDATPSKHSYNSLNPRMLEVAHRELDERLKQGIVEPSDSPWCSPLLMLKKPTEGWRWVVDLRKLNEKIQRPNAHQLPKINGSLMTVNRPTIISSIDIRDAYCQIPLDEESKPKTAFYVPGRGLFQYTRMPAGLRDAAGRWQAYIDKILGYHPNVLVYMDDILIWSPNHDWSHHKEVLHHVLKRLADANLTIKMDKCKFGRKQLLYLGHLLDQYGIRPNPKQVAAVMNFPTPKNVKNVRQFLGLAGWLRKFINSFSIIARPLSNLTKKDQKFHWGEAEEISFMKLKEKLCSEPVLKNPDFNLPFRVYADGSALGTGGILVQEVEGREHVIAYTSKTLLKREEKNFSATELECLAVLHAIEAFRMYIEGYRFELVTDHASLRWLLSLKNPKGRLARWVIELQAYDFSIVHRKGNQMQAPDALSRNPVDVCLIDLPLQVTDEWYNHLLKSVQENPEKYEQFVEKDDCLLKQISVGNKEPLRWVQVLPKNSRPEALRQAHDDETSGHQGAFKTFNRLRRQAYWPKMRREVHDYVKNCQVCQMQKSERRKAAGLMGSTPVVSKPCEVMTSDLVGPLPRSTQGKTFLLVTVDYFTKYAFLKPLRDATARAVVNHIEHDIFLVYGCPRVILVDNGPQYRSREFREMCGRYGVDIRFNIPYTPRQNPTERYNQTIECMIRSYITGNQRKWDQNISKIQAALRTSINEVTRYSPHRLMFGEDLILDGRAHQYDGNPNFETADRKLHLGEAARRQEIFADVKERMKLFHEKNRVQYNLRRRDVSYPVGALVWRRLYVLSNAQKGISAKLSPRWKGPFRVKAKVGKVSYMLEDQEGKEDGPWHVEQLKKFYGQFSQEAEG